MNFMKMQKYYPLYLVLLLLPFSRLAAEEIIVDLDVPGHKISPLIYGINNCDSPEFGISTRRLGGNRLTGYNWENNSSSAGLDFNHSSDGYLSQEDVPGQVIRNFHDTGLEMGTWDISTLQCAGFVAADKAGPVPVEETAPSHRWVRTVTVKGKPLRLEPNLEDDAVYMDEQLNFILHHYGPAHSERGIKGYCIDNEPALWPSTHPRIHPDQTTAEEVIRKNIEMGAMIKSMDPSAVVFGGVLYGFYEFTEMQGSKDWTERHRFEYPTFGAMFLDAMRKAEIEHGKRLIDTFDYHMYSESRGTNASGKSVRIVLENSEGQGDPKVAYTRMQAPRSFWDPTYSENSWIAQNNIKEPIQLIPRFKSLIEKYYPGTKLSFTEYNHGGEDHISGAIAQADTLGIFGMMDVYYASFWGNHDQNFIKSAFRIFRNYDGRGGKFGETHLPVRNSDVESRSVYASLDGDKRIHLVVINKRGESRNFDFRIKAKERYNRIDVWGFSQTPKIRKMKKPPIIQAGAFSLQAQPFSVMHIVLSKGQEE